ncbi:MAG: hypothetical protein GY940_44540 [bacterium]|nr:hypothetical protein [bacterium]
MNLNIERNKERDKERNRIPFCHYFKFKDRDYLLAVILPIVAFGVIFLLVHRDHFSGRLMELSDQASYAIQIIEAQNFDVLVGPYSRFGFNHPGPILFYYHALMEPLIWFIRTPMGIHLFSQFLLNLFFLFLVLQIVYRSYKNKLAVYLFFICLLVGLLPITPKVFISIWPPHVLVIPMVLCALSAIQVALGKSRYFPELALSAVFILQCNLSGALIVLPVSAIAMGLFFMRQKKDPLRNTRRKKWILIFTLLFVVISFTPPLLEELRPGEGNLTKIYRFYQNKEPGSHSFKDVSHYLLGYYYTPVVKLFSPGSQGAVSPVAAVLLLLLFLLLAINLVYRYTGRGKGKRKPNHEPMPQTTLYLIYFIAAAFVLSFFGAGQIPGELLDYIYFYQLGIAGLLYFVLLSGLTGYLRPLLLSLSSRIKIKDVIAAGAMIVFILIVSLRYYEKVPVRIDSVMINKMVRFIKPRPDVTYELFFKEGGKHHNQWTIAVGLALKLKRMGIRYCVSKEWQLIFGTKKPCGNKSGIRRISFYNPKQYRSPARERALSFQKTIIEFGELRKKPLPFKLYFDSSDEYFRDWHGASSVARAFTGQSASFRIPMAPVDETVKTCRLEITGRSVDRGRVFNLTLNGHFLAELSFGHEGINKKAVDFDAGLLNAAESTLIEIQCQAPHPTHPGGTKPLVFVFESLQIKARED